MAFTGFPAQWPRVSQLHCAGQCSAWKSVCTHTWPHTITCAHALTFACPCCHIYSRSQTNTHIGHCNYTPKIREHTHPKEFSLIHIHQTSATAPTHCQDENTPTPHNHPPYAHTTYLQPRTHIKISPPNKQNNGAIFSARKSCGR